MSDDRKAIAALCKCGGWVMLAALGFSSRSDADSWRELASLVEEGFEARTDLTVEEGRQLRMCPNRGECTHPGAAREQEMEESGQLNALEPTP